MNMFWLKLIFHSNFESQWIFLSHIIGSESVLNIKSKQPNIASKKRVYFMSFQSPEHHIIRSICILSAVGCVSVRLLYLFGFCSSSTWCGFFARIFQSPRSQCGHHTAMWCALKHQIEVGLVCLLWFMINNRKNGTDFGFFCVASVLHAVIISEVPLALRALLLYFFQFIIALGA